MVLFAYYVTAQYQEGDPCDVGDHEDNIGSYRAYPNNCEMYLQCLHGKYGVRRCSPGLHWSVEEGACEWPRKAGCVTFDAPQREEVGGPCYVGDHEDNEGVYVAHPTDCGKYLQCLHHEFGERSCPDGLHWNREVGACDWPQKAQCVQRMAMEMYPVPPIQKDFE